MNKDVVEFLKNLHLLDLALLGTILGFALYGFARGMIKLALILGSIYLGFLIAAIYYVPMAGIVSRLFNVSLSSIAEILAFLLLNFIVAAVLITILFQFFGHLEIQGRAGACIDRPIGMILGFITGIAITAILVNLLSVPYELNNEVHFAGDQAPYLVIFNDWYANSIMRDPLRSVLPALLSSISPLLGGHVPSLLVKTGQTSLLPFVYRGLAALRRI